MAVSNNKLLFAVTGAVSLGLALGIYSFYQQSTPTVTVPHVQPLTSTEIATQNNNTVLAKSSTFTLNKPVDIAVAHTPTQGVLQAVDNKKYSLENFPSYQNSLLIAPKPKADCRECRFQEQLAEQKLNQNIEVENYYIAQLNPNIDLKSQTTLTLPLEEGVSVNLQKSFTDTNRQGHFIWEGQINDAPTRQIDALLNEATLIQQEEGINGFVRFNGEAYRIYPLPQGQHYVVKINQKVKVQQHPDNWEEFVRTDIADSHNNLPAATNKGVSIAAPGSTLSSDPTLSALVQQVTQNASYTGQTSTSDQGSAVQDGSDNTVITILAPYTVPANAASPNIRADITMALNSANKSLRMSNIPVTLEIVHMYQIAGNVTPNRSQTPGESLAALASPNDGLFDDVFSLREQHKADLVALFTSSAYGGGVCGVAYVAPDITGTQPMTAVSAPAFRCLERVALGHEIGHIMGSLHDFRTNGNSYNTIFPHGNGHNNCNAGFGTVMSYACGQWIPRWSSATDLYQGYSIGNHAQEDNVRLWKERASVLANYRVDGGENGGGTTEPTNPTENSTVQFASALEPTLCLGYFNNDSYHYLYNFTCDHSQFNTQWRYSQQQIQSVSQPDLCVTAPQGLAPNHPLRLSSCSNNNPLQQFQFSNGVLSTQGYAIQVNSRYYPAMERINGSTNQRWNQKVDEETPNQAGTLYRSGSNANLCMSVDGHHINTRLSGASCQSAQRWQYENNLLKLADNPDICAAYSPYSRSTRLLLEQCDSNNTFHRWSRNNNGVYVLEQFPRWAISLENATRAIKIEYIWNQPQARQRWQESQTS